MDWISLDDALAGVRQLAGSALEAYECRPGKDARSAMYCDLPASVYHADREALSCSMLKPLLVSPAHFQASLLEPGKPSPAKDFGTVVHLLVLEPQNLSAEVAVFCGVADGRDRDYKAFAARNSHRVVIDEPTLRKARELAHKIATTRFRGRPLTHFIEESKTECSIYFTEPITGLRLRVRFDAYHPEFSFDLKTTRHATRSAFARDAVDLSYDLQAYLYSLARASFEGTTGSAPFIFISAETAAPNSVCTHLAGKTFLENGEAKLRECLTTYKACTMVRHWPDLSCSTTLEIQPWQQYVAGNEGHQDWRAGLG
ncbi:PD-(D/E)XK nuclease-like domain-containing protein [Ramlibacter albus]|uniref:PD-(D/E)XK nuclease-like domain-containing protein n=1 Tax=Ramlibacter albus TaxID=2079448 RepID=A0A923S0D3_9BURK|nr:PD-(D/E)XK nuclease-like domain-containing protein [Ramlibacter albus]MBC5763086.1 PD-(D/E)XK nuclease-like domain-containing protein [Ramlibacter albus]